MLERYEEAHQYYNDTIRLYTEELEAPPSKELMDRFCAMREKLVQRENALPQIQENLMEATREKGAYFCAYPGFVDVYHAICRGTERNGQTAILMICNLQQIQNAREKRNSQSVSEWLRESIRSSLRRGDMCTRYSRSKYLILLTGVREADCGIIMKRIKNRFESSRSTEGYRLEFSVAKAEESLELPPES
ncbi:MAG: hypothetical protein Q4F28_11815 [Eubacteriales bacterium]|nr:hypothetical protein [Eubacteriales bacterium]